jgi:hypothetical protein
MATRKSKKDTQIQNFDSDQTHYINKGIVHQTTLKNHINEALFKNPFNVNYILSSLPGLGKTWETEQALKLITDNPPLIFNGTPSISAFIVDIATAVYLSGKKHLVVVLDDCDLLFDDKNINIAKKMFDGSKVLKYTKQAKGLKPFCTDIQWAAIESFADPTKAGFEVSLKNVTFLILTNRYLHTVNDVDGMEAGTAKASKATDLYAIRRRNEYKAIEMPKLELWGYVANVVLNEQICEKWMPSITSAMKVQILDWIYTRWDRVTERNLSLVEKMTRDIVRYPKTYLDMWASNYLQIVSEK